MMFILDLKTLGYKRFRGLAQEHLARYWESCLNYSLNPGSLKRYHQYPASCVLISLVSPAELPIFLPQLRL